MSWHATDIFLLSSALPTEGSRGRLRRLLDERYTEIDWVGVVRRAEFHHLTSLLRYNLSRIDKLQSIPEETRGQLNDASRVWAARHLAYVNEAARLMRALNGGGVIALPLKGAALMLSDYYPQAGLRAALDIDLLIDPERTDQAERIVEELGYLEIPGRRKLRPRQRLANERNHLWPRRGTSGILLELHHRAFQVTHIERDFGFPEMIERARAFDHQLQPAPSDLAFHLIHHALVDLNSTHAILRTLVDLHFIFAREPNAREGLNERAREYGLTGAVELAERTLQLLSDATLEELSEIQSDREVGLLLETALLESPSGLIDAARLFEYFDFTKHPIHKLGNLISLVFTPRSHLEQVSNQPKSGGLIYAYLRRPFDLMRKFNWAGMKPANLSRVRKLRKLATRDEKE